MPGGGGGGIAGMLMHVGGGGGGMGGPGGGMGGMMGGQQQQQNQSEEKPVDEYDVDRWARADGLDAPTLVQQVRADWERKDAEEKSKSNLRRFFSRFSRKKKKKAAEAEAEPQPRPVNNTVTMPDMKRAQEQHSSAPPPPANIPRPPEPPKDACRMCNPNYLGLTFESGIDDFFKSDPLNSAILAVDSLSMSDLTLSQVVPPVQSTHRCRRVLHQQEQRRRAEQIRKAATQTPPATSADSTAPIIAREVPSLPAAAGATPYMDAFRDAREARKYDVRVPR